MDRDNPKKDNVQCELEELSWSFMLEVEKADRQEESEAETEEEQEIDFLAPEEEAANDFSYGSTDNNEAQKSNGNFQNNEWDWYTNKKYDYGVNDMGRQSGIVFDEEKLEAHRVTNWHRPQKIRESVGARILLALKKIISWPFRAVYFGVANLIKGIGSLIWIVFNLLFSFFRFLFLTARQDRQKNYNY